MFLLFFYRNRCRYGSMGGLLSLEFPVNERQILLLELVGLVSSWLKTGFCGRIFLHCDEMEDVSSVFFFFFFVRASFFDMYVAHVITIYLHLCQGSLYKTPTYPRYDMERLASENRMRVIAIRSLYPDIVIYIISYRAFSLTPKLFPYKFACMWCYSLLAVYWHKSLV